MGDEMDAVLGWTPCDFHRLQLLEFDSNIGLCSRPVNLKEVRTGGFTILLSVVVRLVSKNKRVNLDALMVWRRYEPRKCGEAASGTRIINHIAHPATVALSVPVDTAVTAVTDQGSAKHSLRGRSALDDAEDKMNTARP